MASERDELLTRAEALCTIYKATRNANHGEKCGECQRVAAALRDVARECAEIADDTIDADNDKGEYNLIAAAIRERFGVK